ncbi:MAG: hypothetical protein EBR79_02675 [Proteobacteria bacterium]|nr:hypothetical protein [Pseudomonadota bacterium]NBX85699.1 hypothetical protein [Pseudomonadota bacterium]
MAANNNSNHLHYDKQKLLKDYTTTFALMMATMVIGVAGALAYFFGLITYLGGWSHSKSTPFVNTFADRITLEYQGTKLPMYQDPSLAEGFLKAEEKAKKAH